MRSPARDRRAPRDDVDNGAGGLERNPVADHGKLCAIRPPPKPARDPAARRARVGQDVVLAAMLDRDPPRGEALLAIRLECDVPGVVPTERREVRHGAIVIDGCRRGVDRANDSSHLVVSRVESRPSANVRERERR